MGPAWARHVMCESAFTSPEQVQSSGRPATFNLWTGMFWDGTSFIADENLYRCDLVVTASFVGTGYTARR